MTISTTLTSMAAHTYSLNSKFQLTYTTGFYALDIQSAESFADLYQLWAEGNGTVALIVE